MGSERLTARERVDIALQSLKDKPIVKAGETPFRDAMERQIIAAEQAAAAAERGEYIKVATDKAAQLRRDRDTFEREGDREAEQAMEEHATVADEIARDIRARGRAVDPWQIVREAVESVWAENPYRCDKDRILAAIEARREGAG